MPGAYVESVSDDDTSDYYYPTVESLASTVDHVPQNTPAPVLSREYEYTNRPTASQTPAAVANDQATPRRPRFVYTEMTTNRPTTPAAAATYFPKSAAARAYRPRVSEAARTHYPSPAAASNTYRGPPSAPPYSYRGPSAADPDTRSSGPSATVAGADRYSDFPRYRHFSPQPPPNNPPRVTAKPAPSQSHSQPTSRAQPDFRPQAQPQQTPQRQPSIRRDTGSPPQGTTWSAPPLGWFEAAHLRARVADMREARKRAKAGSHVTFSLPDEQEPVRTNT